MPDMHKLKEVLVHHMTEKKAARQWWTISKLPHNVLSWVAESLPRSMTEGISSSSSCCVMRMCSWSLRFQRKKIGHSRLLAASLHHRVHVD